MQKFRDHWFWVQRVNEVTADVVYGIELETNSAHIRKLTLPPALSGLCKLSPYLYQGSQSPLFVVRRTLLHRRLCTPMRTMRTRTTVSSRELCRAVLALARIRR